MNEHKDTVVLINATPHALAYEVRDDQPFRLLSWDGQQRTRGSVSGKTLLLMVVDVRFPILAIESVYLAPEQRWADRLGVPA